VWKQVKDEVQKRYKPQNIDEMWIAVNLAWEYIPQKSIQKLISIMPNQMEDVIATKSGSTRS